VHLNIFISVFNQLDAQNFDVLLTVHLSIFISVFNQLDAQNVDVLLTVHLSIFISVFNQLDAQNFDVLLTVHISIFISVFNQLDAQNLFHNKFYFMLLHVSSTCAHHQEVKIALHSRWYHHTTPAKPQRNTNTHRTRAIQPMK